MSFAQRLLETQQTLKQIAADHGSVAFANSLGTEDMVLMDLITKHAPTIEIFSIDTGRLPVETYDLIERAIKHYRRKIIVYFPEQRAVENFVRINGINGFRDSVAQRQDCCHARKVEPLKRALREDPHGLPVCVVHKRPREKTWALRNSMRPTAYKNTIR